MWERRHGFPVPARLPSGHRRYRREDVERVMQVLREREAGLSVGACHRAGPSLRRRSRAVAVRRDPPPPARPACGRAAQAAAAGADARDRGRELRPRGAAAAVRILPARALLPRLRGSLAGLRADGCAGGRVRRLRALPGRLAGRGAGRPLGPADARVGGGLLGTGPRRVPDRPRAARRPGAGATAPASSRCSGASSRRSWPWPRRSASDSCERGIRSSSATGCRRAPRPLPTSSSGSRPRSRLGRSAG